MRKYTQVEKLAFELHRKGMVNNERANTQKTWNVMYCGRSIFQSPYYHFCKGEINRLVAAGVHQRNHLTIK